MKRSHPPSPALHAIHTRALMAALRAAHGDLDQTARALGITREKLLTLIDGDPSTMWTARSSRPSLPPLAERTSSPSIP